MHYLNFFLYLHLEKAIETNLIYETTVPYPVRGFKKAGVQTLLMSLWPVDDTATEILMTEFYRQLVSGKTMRDAFQSAQHHLRTTDGGKWNSPNTGPPSSSSTNLKPHADGAD